MVEDTHPKCGRKKRGRHPERVLSAAFVRTVTQPGRYFDGLGLSLKALAKRLAQITMLCRPSTSGALRLTPFGFALDRLRPNGLPFVRRGAKLKQGCRLRPSAHNSQ